MVASHRCRARGDAREDAPDGDASAISLPCVWMMDDRSMFHLLFKVGDIEDNGEEAESDSIATGLFVVSCSTWGLSESSSALLMSGSIPIYGPNEPDGRRKDN